MKPIIFLKLAVAVVITCWVVAFTAGTNASELPMKVLFGGDPGDAWETVGVAGGNFKKFGRFENGKMIVSVPEKNRWGKTGILSKEPIIDLDYYTLEKAPCRLKISVDPASTTGYAMALDGSRNADMWRSHRLWVHVTPSSFYFHSGSGQSFDMPGNWDGTFTLVIGNGWCSMAPSGGKAIRKEVPFKPGDKYYMTLLSHPPKEHQACALTLESITLQKIAPEGMTPLERWELVDDADFDPDAYLRALASED
jgi:hypothetical protein